MERKKEDRARWYRAEKYNGSYPKLSGAIELLPEYRWPGAMSEARCGRA